MDFGDGLDVGVDVERRHGVLVAEDRLERLDIAALADPLRCERVAKAADLADSHPRVQGEYDRPLILGGPIESELLSGILFAHDFEKVSGLATKGEA